MADRKFCVLGFPENCNPVKVRLILQGQCKLKFADFKIVSSKAEVVLESNDDIHTFIQNIPKNFQFGGMSHALSIQKSDDADKKLEEATPSLPQSSHSSVKEQKYDFTLVHTWFTLQSILDATTFARCLLVQTTQSDISPNQIIQYFQNKQLSNGGVIAHSWLMTDGIIIIFQSLKTNEDVLLAKPHTINGKKISVQPKEIPERSSDRIVLKNAMKQMKEEFVMIAMTNCSPKGIKPQSIKRPNDIWMIIYGSPLEPEDLQAIVVNAREKYGGENAEIFILNNTDCIKVGNVSASLCIEEIRTVFESKECTAGGQVTRVDRLKNEDVLVYFSSYKDAEANFKKFVSGSLKLLAEKFKIELYFHCFSNDHNELKEENPIDKYFKTWKEREAPPTGFVFDDIDTEVHSFIYSRKEHQQILNSMLDNCANLTFSIDHVKRVIQVYPTLNKGPKDHFTFKEKCTRTIYKFLDRYKSIKHSDFKLENIKEVRKHNLNPTLSAKYTSGDDEEVSIKWIGNNKEILLVTGLEAEVKSTIDLISNLIDIENETLKLEKGQLRWLCGCGYIYEIKKKHTTVGIQSNEDKNEIVFTGTDKEISKARMALVTPLVHLKEIKVDFFNDSVIEFLSEQKIQPQILANFTKLFKRENIKAILTMENNIPYLWTDGSQCESATTFLKKILVCDETISLPSTAYRNVTKSYAWKNLIQELEGNGLLQVQVKFSKIQIIGFEAIVKNAKGKIKINLEENVIRRQSFKTSYGKAIYLLENHKTFHNRCKNSVQYGLEPGMNGGIYLEGKEKDIVEVDRQLSNYEKHLTSRQYVLQNFMIVDYIRSKEGKESIEKASQLHDCVILPESDKYPSEEIEMALECKEVEDNAGKLETATRGSVDSQTQIGPLTIAVRQGNIVDEKNDIIVNSTGSDFDFKGQVSQAILSKGGQGIADEAKSATGNQLRVTSGGKLPCKKIFHVATPHQVQKIAGCLVDILHEAERQRCSSVSIPAIGTGIMKLDPSVVSKIMLQGFQDFAKENPNTKSLKRVDVVIYEASKFEDFRKQLTSAASVTEDLPVKQIFEQQVQHAVHHSTVVPSSQSSSSIALGSLTISVCQGDITNEKNDVIINVTGNDFNLSKGMVAKAILAKGGSQIQREVNSASGSRFRVTSGGNLSCKKIFHVVGSNDVKEIGNCMMNILQEAEKQQLTSVSIPAMGTGNNNVASTSVATVMLQTFQEFVKKNPQTKYLRKVDVVVFDQSKILDFQNGIIAAQSGSTTSFGPLSVSVRQGDITNESNDIIINIIGNDFILGQGMVSKAILSKGGKQIQTEVSSASGSRFRVTSGGNLSCKKIFHVVGSNDVKEIGDCLMNILQEAEKQQLTSVSIPAMGTGNNNVASTSVATVMLQTFQEFVKKNPQTKYLRKVDVVVFDQSKILDFQNGIIAAQSGSTTSFGPLSVSVRQGDITNESNDIIINIIGNDFILGQGMVSKAILSKGGKQIQTEVSSASGSRFRVTSGGNLSCKKIFHVVGSNDVKEIGDCLMNILQEAEKQQLTSVSIPAIGTGNQKVASTSVARVMLQTFQDFANKYPQTKYLRKVDVVIFDQSKIQDFENGIMVAQAGAVPKSILSSPLRSTGNKSPGPSSGGILSPSSPRNFGTLVVLVRQGDITKETNDAIVNSCSSSFNLSTGLVSTAIISKGGQKIQTEANAASGTDIRVTSGGDLKCKKIFHVAFPDKIDGIKSCLVRLLKEVDDQGCSSVSIPAVGTGNKGLSNAAIAAAVSKAIEEFAILQTKHLKMIDIVIFDNSMLQDFRQVFDRVKTTDPVTTKSQPAKFLKRIRKVNKSSGDTVKLYFFSQQLINIEKAWNYIKQEVERAYAKEKIDGDMHKNAISNLTECEMEEIEDVEAEMNVKVTIKKRKKEIKILGLRKNVSKASRDIQEILYSLSQAITVKFHAGYNWQHQTSTGWTDFEPRPHQTIEEAYQKYNDKYTEYVQTSSSDKAKMPVSIYFNGMKQSFQIDFKELKMIGQSVTSVRRIPKQEFPKHWDTMKTDEEFVTVLLNSASSEYQKVKGNMTATLPNCHIFSVSRIQNEKLFTKYKTQKRLVEPSVKNKPIERQLFHGTNANTAKEIMQKGFNRSYAGKNATFFGKGVYFAKNADYSDQPKYASPDSNGHKTLFLVDVITGDYCKGNPDLIALDLKPGSKHVYESAVNDVNDPTIFVVFEDASVYPAYIIQYK